MSLPPCAATTLGVEQDPSQRGQGLVEYALILALCVLVVIIALLLTGKQVINMYSDITATMCNYHAGC